MNKEIKTFTNEKDAIQEVSKKENLIYAHIKNEEYDFYAVLEKDYWLSLMARDGFTSEEIDGKFYWNKK